jgi:hypothetical protein
MSGLEGFALGAAPLAGGALLGGMAGKGTDLRAVIKSELDLLERIPEDRSPAEPRLSNSSHSTSTTSSWP